MDAEYDSLGPEDRALAEAFAFSPQLESVMFIEFGEDPEGLWQYIRELLSSFLHFIFMYCGLYQCLLF